ncbi:MAG: AAA family ATPase [Candidatus Peribacteraceae bacterium]|nr:AAA family ATPase [Candidatus Peribacteraceae bacterium]
MITTETKQQICEKLNEYVLHIGSQNKAANSLKGVSAGTLSQMQNNNWELIKDSMWRNVATQILRVDNSWQAVETRSFTELTDLLSDAQMHSGVFGVTGDAGTGKSFAIKKYVDNNKEAYLLSCAEYWNRKYFLSELLTAMGRDYSGMTVAEMMQEAVSRLKKVDRPIIIMDEADKLSDQVLYFFITLYNQLEEHCAIILCATDHLAKRIKRGLKLNKKGYKEIYSRMGKKFIELEDVGSTDVMQVCMANGINDRQTIKEIYEDCEGDLRRVKRKIHALRMANNPLNAN